MGCVAPSGATSPRATCHNKGHSVRCYLNSGRIERTRNHLPLLSVTKTSVVIMDARLSWNVFCGLETQGLGLWHSPASKSAICETAWAPFSVMGGLAAPVSHGSMLGLIHDGMRR